MNDTPPGQERKTCMPCRKRKVKCDGRSPKCGPCSVAKREFDCVFPLRPENRDKRNALPKGRACLSCRSKKKKCDGHRPICSTCSRSRDGQPCIYDENNHLSHTGSEDELGDETTFDTLHKLGPPTYTTPQVEIPSPSMSPSTPSTPPSPQPMPLLRAVDERQWGYFRSLAFAHELRLGICFTRLKERFIREGDLSGRVVHPWFTWFMAVMGVHLHQEGRHEWQQLAIQRMLTQVLLGMIVRMRENDPPFEVLQAWYLMAMSCTYTHTIVPGARYLMRCQELVTLEDLRLVEPTWIDASTRASPPAAVADDRLPEYTEKKHEVVSVLVNLMYLQCMNCLLYDVCHGMFAELEAQLPEFARAYPEVFDLSSFVLRTRTVLLVRDVFLHIKLLKESSDISQKEWLTDAVNLVSRLGVVLGVLDTAVNQNDTGRMSPGEPHEKRQTYLLLSSCKLFCMTARARIYMETSKLPIVPRDQVKKFRNLSGESTQAFLQIFKTFNQVDDLRHLDYFIVPCFHHIRELYMALYPGELDWYPIGEVNHQIITLEGTLRVTPAGRGVSVVHSMVGLSDSPSDEPDFLKEEERLKWGL